jgi:hypothetical protein
MPGLVPGIHALLGQKEGVDGRVKPGHDAEFRQSSDAISNTSLRTTACAKFS